MYIEELAEAIEALLQEEKFAGLRAKLDRPGFLRERLNSNIGRAAMRPLMDFLRDEFDTKGTW